MVAVNGAFYAVEPNHGEFDVAWPNGNVKRIVDISNIQGHIVPTAVAYDGHDFFVGNLDTFPIKDGSSKIMKITPDGKLTTVYIGFSVILGLAFDSQGRLYVLENTTGNPGPTPIPRRSCELMARTTTRRSSMARRQPYRCPRP